MVQRYDARRDYFGGEIDLPKGNQGRYVLYTDYTALEQRCRELEEESEGWKNGQLQMQDISDSLFVSNNELGRLLKEAKAKIAELEAELKKWRDSRDGVLTQIEELEAENAELRKKINEA